MLVRNTFENKTLRIHTRILKHNINISLLHKTNQTLLHKEE